jgi:hypothetical protein
MNKAGAYSYLGSIIGAGAGFCVSWIFFVALLKNSGGTEDAVSAILLLFYLPLLTIASILIGKLWSDKDFFDYIEKGRLWSDDKTWFAALILFFIGLFICLPVAVVAGVEMKTYYMAGLRHEFVGFTPLFPLVLAIPFGGFGTINGYYLGRLIGEKADERDRERKAYQQKIEAYMRKLRQWEAEGYKVEELKEKWGLK